MKIILESVDEEKNRYRRYIVAMSRSLFGEYTVIRAALKNVPKRNAAHYAWFQDRLLKRNKVV